MQGCSFCPYGGDLDEEKKDLDVDGVAVVAGYSYSCPECGETYEGFDQVEGAFATIAQALAGEARRLEPHELRWLRKWLGFSAQNWAGYLSVRRETVSQWENGHNEMPLGTERLLRLLVKNGDQFRHYESEPMARGGGDLRMVRNSVGEWVRA